MDEKVFDLLEKVYIELQDTKKELKQDIKCIDSRLTKLEIKIENDISQKISALYEDREIVHDRLSKIEDKLDRIDNKIEKQEIEIKVLKGGKK